MLKKKSENELKRSQKSSFFLAKILPQKPQKTLCVRVHSDVGVAKLNWHNLELLFEKLEKPKSGKLLMEKMKTICARKKTFYKNSK